MSVFKRKSKYGETREYHYKFMQGGKWFYGVCEGCTTERSALAYEKKIKETAKTASEQKSVKALIDNFADQLTGGSAVPLADALELYLKKPKKRMPGAKQLAQKISYWGDFTAWMAQSHPEVVNLRDGSPLPCRGVHCTAADFRLLSVCGIAAAANGRDEMFKRKSSAEAFSGDDQRAP